MKNIIIGLLLLSSMALSGNVGTKSEVATKGHSTYTYVTTHQHGNHTYVITILTGINGNAVSTIHDPDCWCEK